jgi:hypothetical protein
MQSEFRPHIRRYLSLLMAPTLLLLLFLTGCSTTSGTSAVATTGTGTSTTSTTATTGSGSSGSGDTGSGSSTPAVPAPPHAFAWTQYDHATTRTPQIWASINGGVPYQVTHLAPITDGCDTQVAWGLPVFSPNLTHIVASIGSFNCGDGDLQGPIDVINASSGAITAVPGANSFDRSSVRTDGWLNNNTIFFVNSAGLFTYTLGAGSPTQLPGVTGADEAVLRGSTLFWTRITFASGPKNWTSTLYRYDMNTHTALPGSISLGQVHMCECSPGDVLYQGWDASPDGSHVAYQVTTPLTGATGGIASSHIYYANANGSGASQIASYMATNSTVDMQISPNGQLVGFTDALPTPSVITASVSSPGHAGDPNFHTYTPDANCYPVWKWNSSSFWAANRSDGDFESPGTPALHYYTVGTVGAVIGVNGGFNPWYTIA